MSPMQWALYAELRHAQHLVYHLAYIAALAAPATQHTTRRNHA
jgi:hypothetical protein